MQIRSLTLIDDHDEQEMYTQQKITYSKLITEILKQGVNDVALVSLLLLLTLFLSFSSVSIVDFE